MAETPPQEPQDGQEAQDFQYSEADGSQPSAAPANPFGEAAAVSGEAERRTRRIRVWIAALCAALLLTIGVVWYVSAKLQQTESVGLEQGLGGGGAADGSDEPTGDGEHAEMDPVAWPANMVTGGVLISGDGDELSVIRSEALEPGSEPSSETLIPENADGSQPAHIRVYLDYRCPYCLFFEEASGDTLAAVAKSGDAVVELVPLTFLDRYSQGTYYSSRVAASLACVTDAQPEAAWDTHASLLHADFQPSEGTPGHDNEAIIERLDEATGGLNDEARSCISEERFVPFAQALDNWVFTNPVPGAQDPELSVTGTPLVLVDGVPYPGDPADGRAFTAFLEQSGVEVG